MKWILLVIIMQGSDGGAATAQIPFETKELCQKAAKQVEIQFGVKSSQGFCLEVKGK